MSKGIRLAPEDWEAIYACVLREYRRQFAKTVKDALGRRKALDDAACQRWLNLIEKLDARLELLEKDRQSQN